MKKTFFILSLGLLAPLTGLFVHAAEPSVAAPTEATPSAPSSPDQDKKFERGHRKERMSELRRLSSELNLSKEQQRQIKGVFKQRRDAVQALPEAERKGPKAAAVREEYRLKARALLTPEQQTKFDAMKDDAKKRRKAGN